MRTLLILLLAALPLGCSSSQTYGDTLFELKGDRLGMDVETFIKNSTGTYGKPPRCYEGFLEAPLKRKPTIGLVSCQHRGEVTIANMPVELQVYEFVDGKLYQISMSFPSDFFDVVSAGLVEKYGKPTHHIKSDVQNRFGATSKKESMAWRSNSSSIWLVESGLTITHRVLLSQAVAKTPKARPDL